MNGRTAKIINRTARAEGLDRRAMKRRWTQKLKADQRHEFRIQMRGLTKERY
jgi:hypothetical protein